MNRQPRPWITINDPKRAEEFAQIFGSPRVPVETERPIMARLPIGIHLIYSLDFERLTQEQRNALIADCMTRHNCDRDFVIGTLEVEGMAILASDTTLEMAVR